MRSTTPMPCWSFRSPASVSRAWPISRSGAARYPAKVSYKLRRVTVRDDIAIVECSVSYNDGPFQFGIQLLDFRGDKVARERIYVMEGWEAPAWRAEWRSATPSE